MKTYYIYAILFFTLLLSSCSADNVVADGTINNEVSEYKNIKRIEHLISEFHSKVHPETRNSISRFKISSIDSDTYHLPDSLSSNSRSSIRNTYDMHTVSIDFAESQGYAILSDTPGIDQIFFYTESGAISDTTYNIPLRNMIKSYPEIAAQLLSNDDITEMQFAEGINIQPLVRFEWDQGYPFNSYGQYCDCSKCSLHRNHMPIGCVAIAVAQTIATLGKFKGSFYGTRNIDFSTFPNRGYQFSSIKATEVGHFLQEISLNCQMKYGCNGSGTHIEPAYKYLLDLGYDCQLVEFFLDKPRLISNLKLGLPHLIAAHEVNGGGHMWIIDGCISDGYDYKYHMNWGWGYYSSNGWTTGSFFKDEISSHNYSQDHQHIYFGGTLSFYPFE